MNKIKEHDLKMAKAVAISNRKINILLNLIKYHTTDTLANKLLNDYRKNVNYLK